MSEVVSYRHDIKTLSNRTLVIAKSTIQIQHNVLSAVYSSITQGWAAYRMFQRIFETPPRLPSRRDAQGLPGTSVLI